MKTNKLTLSFVLLLLLVGCSSNLSYDKSRLCIDDDGIYKRCDLLINGQTAQSHSSNNNNSGEVANIDGSALSNLDNNKLLADYVEQLAMQLIDTLTGKNLPESVAVTSFVTLGDENENEEGAWLGQQITEAFYHELQLFGLSVVDVGAGEKKSPSYLSWLDDLSLKDDLMITGSYSHILFGTLSPSKKGIIINSRIVSVESQTAIATAKGLIPQFVLASDYN